MEYHLDYQQAADKTGLKPVIDTAAPSNVTKQVSAAFRLVTMAKVSPSVFLAPGSHPAGLWRRQRLQAGPEAGGQEVCLLHCSLGSAPIGEPP